MAKNLTDTRQCSLVFSVHSNSHSTYRTLREATHHAAHSYRGGMKMLAAEMDIPPSLLSMSTVLGEGDHLRANDADQMLKVEILTRNLSPLYTHAALLGHKVTPCTELAVEALQSVAHLFPQIETLYEALKMIKGSKP